MKTVEGARALVTGASSGIGKAITKQLLEQGAEVVAVARNPDKLKNLADECDSTRLHTIQADLSVVNGVSTLVKKLETEDFRENINLLVNNAGIGYYGRFDSAKSNTFRKMVNLNIAALTELTHYLIEPMKHQKSGGILNISSMAGFTPVPGFAVYAATKSYVTNLSKALHYELKDYGIHVSSCCPGPVQTDFFENASSSNTAKSQVGLLLPEFVAEVALSGLLQNKKQVIPGYRGKFLYFFNSVIPEILAIKAAAKAVEKHQHRK